ncbi:hypothetical protein D8T63_12850 [Vibrio vulnificus]|nr:hypothetical protein D8T63_12850 [Vibrio vulnificus]RZR44127.1 hypothetical protein D8T57_13880 [Vibrio vulnificus]HAS8486555.1 hypothetical protein [Vibrio vulnificus]HAS8597364.1 hypothetical protein [Vibrio vulnificus]
MKQQNQLAYSESLVEALIRQNLMVALRQRTKMLEDRKQLFILHGVMALLRNSRELNQKVAI